VSDEEKPAAGGDSALSSSVDGNRLIRSVDDPDEWVASDTTVLDLLGEFEQADPA
jgi:hypothetical protein